MPLGVTLEVRLEAIYAFYLVYQEKINMKALSKCGTSSNYTSTVQTPSTCYLGKPSQVAPDFDHLHSERSREQYSAYPGILSLIRPHSTRPPECTAEVTIRNSAQQMLR